MFLLFIVGISWYIEVVHEGFEPTYNWRVPPGACSDWEGSLLLGIRGMPLVALLLEFLNIATNINLDSHTICMDTISLYYMIEDSEICTVSYVHSVFDSKFPHI